MKLGLYPKIAADGIRKNGRLYVPYIATSILMIAVYYILHVLGFSKMLRGFEGASTSREMLQLGSYIMAIFGAIFLLNPIFSRAIFQTRSQMSANASLVLFSSIICFLVVALKMGRRGNIGMNIHPHAREIKTECPLFP